MSSQPCSLCDTLRNDLDNGDECVNCGATYADPEPRRTYVAPVVAAVKAQRVLTGKAQPWNRPGWFRNINGLDMSRRCR